MEVIDNVIRAYEAVKLNDVSKGIIALCTFVAVIIVIQKFVTAWKEAFSEGEKPADMKHFFRLFYIYIYVFAVIMAAPFAFTIVEKALGNVQNELIEHYQEDIDLSIDEAVMTFTKDYSRARRSLPLKAMSSSGVRLKKKGTLGLPYLPESLPYLWRTALESPSLTPREG